MQTVRITTAQNIEIDYQVAELGDRVLARLVDFGVFLGVYMVLFYSYLFIFAMNGASGTVGLIVLGSVWLALYVFYDLVAEIFFNGQSIGKFAIKIRVISLDGARPSINQYLLRWVFRIVDFMTTGGIGAVAIIAVAVTENKQRIGDLVAGTTLIKTKAPAELRELIFMPAEDDGYEPVFTQASQLTDNEVAVIHEVVDNFNRIGNSAVVYETAKQLENHLGVVVPKQMNDYQFLTTLIKDHNYLISKMEA